MDEEVKQKLLEYLTRLETATDKGAEFVGEQVPLFVQEYLAWYWWSSLVGIGIGLLLGLIGLVCLVVGFRIKDTASAPELEIVAWGLGAFLPCFISGVVIAANTHALIKVTVAPRVVVVEELSKILR